MNSFDVEIAKSVAATGVFEYEQAKKLLTIPTDTEHGNFSLPCFVLARTLHKAPKLIAEELASKIQLSEGISKVEAVAGYLNFFIDRNFLAKSILEEISEKRNRLRSRKPKRQDRLHRL